mgnify:CR=1 FL=1
MTLRMLLIDKNNDFIFYILNYHDFHQKKTINENLIFFVLDENHFI